ncbi:uncharacterized protein LOC108672852 isoform X2 [Hyalella azteca]|uniref:protein-tyrosine-phosphatase n=1 Tax=Hyalella azteca TaxID=294128 RepID=A0A8B7NQS9_HYAAZ|nr:uncharacterized protein LOC108672852 isoform X2 [Hyalella azteca]
MPFKLPFTKTRHYNVVSRSVLVVCVELLDSSTLECTLSADSTGQHCLHNVAQRIGLGQPEFFGLRYMSKRPYPKVRWVELDRPLKKQLDKFAQSPALTLSVLYYIHDVGLLHDDTTRSHFFMQVKQDVLDGKLRCNYEQAVLLASYSLQAELGDHQQDRHTPEYLKDFVVLPKLPSLSEPEVTVLLELAVWQYASLRGLAQSLAETYYILEAQRLEGYGQETFMARDERGSEVYLGASLVGVTVRPASGHSVTTLRWNDISNLVNLKRAFAIECPKSSRTFQFTFDEPDAAKYIWKMCVKQHTFFKRNQELLERSLEEAASGSEGGGLSGEMDKAGGEGKVSVRGLTIPDLQQSVMSATVPPQLLDPDQLSYHQSGRHAERQLEQHCRLQTLHYMASPRAMAAHQDHHLLQESRVNAQQQQQQLYASRANSSAGAASMQDYYDSRYSVVSTATDTTMNPVASGSQYIGNPSATRAVFSAASLNSSRDESASQLKRLDASNPSLYRPPDLLHAMDVPYHTRPPPGDLSSLHLQQQHHYLLYNSNPNLPSAEPEFNLSFRRALLPEYRQAPDYHSVCRAVSIRAAVVGGGDGGGVGTRMPFSLHSTYSTPDLQTAAALEVGRRGLYREEVAELQYRPPPPYPAVRLHLPQEQRLAGYSKSTSSSSPDLVAAAAAASVPQPHFGMSEALGGSWSHLSSASQQPPAARRGLSRTYENLCDLDDVVLSLRNHMAGNNTSEFLHSFSSLGALNDSGSTDCLSPTPAVYRLQHTARNSRAVSAEEEAEPIYQNVLAYSPQPQQQIATTQSKCLVYNQDQLQKLLDHQDCLQQQQQQQQLHQQKQQQQLHHHQQQQQHHHQQQQQQQLQQQQQQQQYRALSGAVTGTTSALVHRSSSQCVQLLQPQQPVTKSNNWSSVDSKPNNSSLSVVSHRLNKPEPVVTNPLSSSVDSTKSSPMMGNSHYSLNAPVRSSESLNDITSSSAANASHADGHQERKASVHSNIVTINHNNFTAIPLSVSSVDIPGNVTACDTNMAVISLSSSRLSKLNVSVVSSASPDPSCAESRNSASVYPVPASSQSVTVTLASASSVPATDQGNTTDLNVVYARNVTHNHSSNDKKISEDLPSGHESPSGAVHPNPTDASSKPSSVAAAASATSAPQNKSQNSSILSRIYATRDPRARVLQNELLSAELPIKFSGIGVAKSNAVFFNERGTVSDITTADLPCPYPDNRVRLQPTSDNKTGYINASHVTATAGQKRQLFYLVQSLAAEDTVNVWRCVWQHDVRVVVLLARCPALLSKAESKRASKTSRILSSLSQRRRHAKEQTSKSGDEGGDAGRGDPLACASCCPYWPHFDNTSLECGAFRIYRRDSTQCEGYTMSRLEVHQQQSNGGKTAKRTVWHIQYMHGLTNTSSFIGEWCTA